MQKEIQTNDYELNYVIEILEINDAVFKGLNETEIINKLCFLIIDQYQNSCWISKLLENEIDGVGLFYQYKQLVRSNRIKILEYAAELIEKQKAHVLEVGEVCQHKMKKKERDLAIFNYISGKADQTCGMDDLKEKFPLVDESNIYSSLRYLCDSYILVKLPVPRTRVGLWQIVQTNDKTDDNKE